MLRDYARYQIQNFAALALAWHEGRTVALYSQPTLLAVSTMSSPPRNNGHRTVSLLIWDFHFTRDTQWRFSIALYVAALPADFSMLSFSILSSIFWRCHLYVATQLLDFFAARNFCLAWMFHYDGIRPIPLPTGFRERALITLAKCLAIIWFTPPAFASYFITHFMLGIQPRILPRIAKLLANTSRQSYEISILILLGFHAMNIYFSTIRYHMPFTPTSSTGRSCYMERYVAHDALHSVSAL